MRILKAYKGEEPLKGVFHGLSIIWPSNLEYFARIVKNNLGGIYESIFSNEYNNLPVLAKTDSEVILVPGAYKVGFIYGIDRNSNIVPFTFTRNGVATYFDKNGIMQTAVAGMPRIDYDPVTKVCKGYSQENVATNLLAWSNDFTKWNQSKLPLIVTEGLNSYGKSKQKLTNNNGETLPGVTHSGVISLANTPYSYRLTLRAGNSSVATIGIGGSDALGNSWGDNTLCSGRIISGVGTLTRNTGALFKISDLSTTTDTVIEITRNITNAGINLVVHIYLNTYNTSVINDSVFISCAQFEAATTCTSYIETTGSQVTRPADVIESVTDIVPYMEASVFMNFAFTRSALGTVMICTKGTFGRFWYSTSASVLCQAYDGTRNTSLANITYGSQTKVATSYGEAGLKQSANGLLPSGGKTTYDGTFGTGVLSFGSGAPLISQHIKALVIFSRQLTDAEHTTITT